MKTIINKNNKQSSLNKTKNIKSKPSLLQEEKLVVDNGNLANSLIGKTICVKINALNINGEGISTYKNKKVCVSGVLPGEEILCIVQTQKPTYLGCKLVEILKPNKARIKPKCKYSGICGGCNFDFIEYKNALEIKKQTLQEYFSNLFEGKIETVESSNAFNYRNKISLCVKNNDIGLKIQNTNTLCKIDKCLITDDNINNIMPALTQIVKSINSQNLKHVVVRNIKNSIIITFVFNTFDSKKIQIIKDFCLTLSQNLNLNFGVYVNINKSNFEILGNAWHHIYGLKVQKANLCNIDFQIHPHSFLQVNEDIRDKIYNYVLNNIQNKTVIEGYSGAGIMSCMIAQKAKQVYSVEINTQSYLNAEQAKLKNNIKNLTNINNSCQNVLSNLVFNNPDSIFLIDPPRSGCDNKTLESLKQSNIKKIIYISCNPYTLKQNIGYIKDFYKIESLTLFDMFPNTFHMETVAILTKK